MVPGCSSTALLLLCTVLALPVLIESDYSEAPSDDAWTEAWWNRSLTQDSRPSVKPHPRSGVGLDISYPQDGSVTRYFPEYGDIVPRVQLELGDGFLADLLRSNLSEWGLCLSLDGAGLGCTPLTGGKELPRLAVDTRRGMHVVRTTMSPTTPLA